MLTSKKSQFVSHLLGNHSEKTRRRRGWFEQLEDRRLLAVNQPPVNDVPGPQETQVNTPLAFTEFRGNLLSVSDPDAGINKLRVTLAATHGNLSFVLNTDPNGGLTYSVGDGTTDATMTFTGTQANINEAFQWIVFNPEPDYIGAEAGITLTTNDQGFFGTGGPKEDVDFIPITVHAVPEFAASPTYETLPAALDPTFDGDGIQILTLSEGVDFIHQMLPLSNGKILAVGAINDHFGVMRFDSNLNLDTTFGLGGVVEKDFGAGNHALTVAQLPDGNLLVAGIDHFVEFDPDGVPIPDFGVDGVVFHSESKIAAVDLQADGKIVVAGAKTGSGGTRFSATRYDANGSIDPTFGTIAWTLSAWQIIQDRATGLHIQDNGKMILAGSILPWPSSRSFGTATVNVFGGLEQSRILNTGYDTTSSSSLLLPDQRILQIGTGSGDFVSSRFLAGGNVDSDFGQGGISKLPVLNGQDQASRARLQADGKILIAGWSHNGINNDFAVVRLNYDGTLDSTFIADGSSALGLDLGIGDEFAYDVVSLPDGKILLAGRAGNDIALVRLLGDSDIISPIASLTDPADGSSVEMGFLNGQGYLDITFTDEGNSGLDVDTITDPESEIVLSGTAAAGVVLGGTPSLVSGSTYRYAFTGMFSEGLVSVEFVAGSVADLAGNTLESAMASFTVTSPPALNADFDEDGDIDGRDFLAWQRGYGIQSPNAVLADGDADGDQDVDSDDLSVWQDQYGTTPVLFAGLSVAGSEPTALDVASAGQLSAADLVDLALATDWLLRTPDEEESFIIKDHCCPAISRIVSTG